MAGVRPARGIRRVAILLTLALIGAFSVSVGASAQAAAPPTADTTFCRIWEASPGESVRIDPRITVSGTQFVREGDCTNGTLAVTDATVDFGDGLVIGRNVQAQVTTTGITVTSGEFRTRPNLSPLPFEVDPRKNGGNISVTFNDDQQGVTVVGGGIRSVRPTPAADPSADTPAPAPGPGEGEGASGLESAELPENPETLIPAFLVALASGALVIDLTFNDEGLAANISVPPSLNINGQINYAGDYRFDLTLDELAVGDGAVSATGTFEAPALDAEATYDVTGTVVRPITLAPDLVLTNGIVGLSNAGIEVMGGLRLACRSGAIDATGTARIRNEGNWEVEIAASTEADGCELEGGVRLTGATVTGTISSADGVVTGGLRFLGRTTLPELPSGFRDWDADVALDLAGPQVTLAISSTGGRLSGVVNGDGTFRLDGALDTDIEGVGRVSGAATIRKDTPTADPSLVFNGSLRDVTLPGGTVLRSASASFDGGALRVSGLVDIPCVNNSGTISVSASGELPVGGGDWSLALGGQVAGGSCALAQGLTLDGDSTIDGSLVSTGGVVTGSLSLSGRGRADFLPAGGAWTVDAGLDITPAGTTATLSLESSVGSLAGAVNPDGTFRLEGELNASVSGLGTVTGDLLIAVDAPGAAPVVQASGGLADVSLPGGARLTSASVRFNGADVTLDGRLLVPCSNTGGSLALAVAGTVPTGGGDWALDLGGDIAGGCAVAPGITLGAGRLVSGRLASTGGTLSVTGSVDATANIADLPAGLREWRTTVGISTSAAGLAANLSVTSDRGVLVGSVAPDGTFALDGTVALDVAGFGSVSGSLGLRRSAPGATPALALSGAVTNVAIPGGGSFTGTANLSGTNLQLSGSVTVPCANAGGSLTLGASGNVPLAGGDWVIDLAGNLGGAGCELSPGLSVNGGTITSGRIASSAGIVSGRVAVDTTVRASFLPGGVDSWRTTADLALGSSGLTASVDLRSSVGGLAGSINPDGTFRLTGNLATNVSGAGSVNGAVTVVRETPGGTPRVEISGSLSGFTLPAGLVLDSGSLTSDGTNVTVAGRVLVPCTNNRTLAFAAAGSFPLNATDWTLGLTGDVPAEGCELGSGITLGAGRLVSGSVRNNGGAITVAADLAATVSAAFLPAGLQSWDVRAGFSADSTGSSVTLGLSSAAGRVDGRVSSNGTFNLAGNAAFDVPGLGRVSGSISAVRSSTSTDPVIGLTGSLSNVALPGGAVLGSGTVTLSGSNLTVAGDVTIPCQNAGGSVRAAASGTVPLSGGDWQLALTGDIAGGCELSPGLTIGTGRAVAGTLRSVSGVVSAGLTVDTSVSAAYLPAGISTWAARAALALDGSGLAANLDLTSAAGGLSGRVNPDGTFRLVGSIATSVSGFGTVNGSATVERTTPTGTPTVSVTGGVGDVALGGGAVLRTASISVGSGAVDFAGSVEIPCRNTGGRLTFGASGRVPSGGSDWSVALTGATTAAGCEPTPGLALAAGQLVSGRLASTGGRLSADLTLDAQATASFLPGGTGNPWSTRASLSTSDTGLVGSLQLTSARGGLSGSLRADAGFELTGSVNADVRGLGRFSGNARIVRSGGSTTPTTTFTGTATNVSLPGGAVLTTASVTGDDSGLQLGGTLTVPCRNTGGSLVLSANGAIPSNGDWSVGLGTTVSGTCELSPGLVVGAGQIVSGTLRSVNGVVSASFTLDAAVSASFLPANATDWRIRSNLSVDGSGLRGSIALSSASTSATLSGTLNADGTFSVAGAANATIPGVGTVAGSLNLGRTTPTGAVATSFSGSVSNVSLPGGMTLVSASVSGASASGTLSFNGSVRVPCLNTGGSVVLGASGNVTTSGNWSVALSGNVPAGGCEFTPGLALAAGSTATGTLASVNGAVAANFSTTATVTASYLPPGASSWTLAANVTADASGVRTAATLSGAGVGTFTGNLNANGTFSLAGTLSARVNGVAYNLGATLSRPSVGATPTLTASAAVSQSASGTSISGSLVWTASALTLTGTLTVPCNPGTATFGLNVPVTASTGNFSATISGAVASGGCRINPEVLLNSGSFSGTLTSTNGALSLTATGNVSVNASTALIPTSTNSAYNGSFTLRAAPTGLSGSLSISGGGATISGNVTWANAYNFSVNATGRLQVRGALLGFSGSVSKNGGAISYSLAGNVSGPIQISENLFLQSGSFSFSSGTNFNFGGQIRVRCNAGDLYVGAWGYIRNNNNWSFSINSASNGCRFGNNLWLGSSPISGTLTSTNGSVNGSFNANINRWDPAVSVWVENISLNLTIRDGWNFRGTLRARGTAELRVMVLFIMCTKRLSADVSVTFDLTQNFSGNVSVTLSNISIGIFDLLFQATLEAQLRNGQISGLSFRL